jgi:phosphoribosylglycinamide formyltransferase 1
VENIAIFASGSGTNAENIINYFKDNTEVTVKLILTNNKEAGVLERAARLGVESVIFSRPDLFENGRVKRILVDNKITFIVLAGFLWLIPKNILDLYEERIINIHPALLPKYGGKGMFGDRVHQAVIENNENETGITIHYVNDAYDEGNVIFQEKCSVDTSRESVDEIAEKVHRLEFEHYPRIIAQLLKKTKKK